MISRSTQHPVTLDRMFNPWELYDTMDRKTIQLQVEMMENGMRFNPDKMEDMREKYLGLREDVFNDLEKLVGYRVLPTSPVQVQRLLFGEMGLRPIKFSKKTKLPSADDKTLEDLKDRDTTTPQAAETIGLIQKYREYDKLLSSYILPIQEFIRHDPLHLAHTEIKNTRVVSGRWSSGDPINLMALPKQGDAAKEFRMAVEPRYKDWVMWTGDYSGIEMRTIGTQDEAIAEVFISGLDIHTNTASKMWSVPYGDVDRDKHRYPAKRVGFGAVFGITAIGLLPLLPAENRTIEFAQWLIDSFYNIYAGMAEFIIKVQDRARQYGAMWDQWGRIRQFAELQSPRKYVVEAAMREAFSHYVQGTAQGVIKIPMGALLGTIKAYGIRAIPLIQIHDDIVMEVHKDDVSLCNVVVGNLMASATSLGEIPIEVEINTGETWAECGAELDTYKAVGTYRTFVGDINESIVVT